MPAPQSRLVFTCSKCGCKKSYPFRLFPSQIKCDECGGLMNPETQAEKPLGVGNSQSGPSKSPPPLPAKNGDLPLLPSAMMFQKVLEKNNFAVVAGVMLVGFGVCIVGIMVFVGTVFLKGKKEQGNQVAEGPGGIKAADKIIADEIEREAAEKEKKRKNDEIKRIAMVEAEKQKEMERIAAEEEKRKNDEIKRMAMVEAEKQKERERIAAEEKKRKNDAENAQGKNPKNYGYERFDPIVELVDKHAFSATKEQEKDIETLASYLGVVGKKYSPANEYLQVRAIYSWITHKIKFDKPALLDGVINDNDAVQVFKNKKAVCHGQANLFKALCDELKIKCHVITGPVKSRFIEDGKLVEHAWNVVEIHGKWHLLDCTWGCMIDNKKNEIRPSLYTHNEFYFLTDPELLILNHFTRDPDWQLLKTPKTYEQFVKEPNYLANNCLVMTGVPLSVFADFVQKNSIDDVVLTLPIFCPIQVLAMPLQGKLEINKKYNFAFKVPANFRIDIKMGESISQPMIENKEGNYIAEITLAKVAPVRIVLWDKENKFQSGNIFAIYNYVKKD